MPRLSFLDGIVLTLALGAEWACPGRDSNLDRARFCVLPKGWPLEVRLAVCGMGPLLGSTQ